MQFVRRDDAFMSSDIEEESAEEADQMDDINNHQQSHKNNNSSPQHHRSFKHHVHFGKVKRKVSAPVNGDCSTSPHSNPSNGNGGGGFGDILEWLRPRAFSDYSKARRRSSGDSGVSSSSGGQRRFSTSSGNNKHQQDDGFHSTEDVTLPLYVDTKMANAWVNAIPQEYLYRRSLSISSDPFVNGQHCCHRQRSNSEFGRYVIMRRSSDHGGGNEFVGRLEENGDAAYCQLLASMKCYDLMPQLGKMVVLDSELPVRKAFMALVNNWIKAAVVLDSFTSTVLGVLTVTDFMNMLLDMNSKKSNDILDMPLSTGLGYDQSSKRQQPIVAYADHSVYHVARKFCQRRVHRVIVFDSENNGDPLFLLSKRMILKSLQKFMSRLPLPRCMHVVLDELQLRLGTWTNVVSVKQTTTLHKALLKFLGKTLSCLPVLNETNVVVDVLTKADVMNLVADEGPTENILQKTVEDALKFRREGVESLITCHKKSTLMLAVECVLQSEAHRLIVVNSDGLLEGIISISDIMRFLLGVA